MRAHIVLDPAAGMHTHRSQGQKFGETFSVTPDFPGQRVVLRHVLAPLMAHHTYKSHASPGYKWMLLGDGECRVKSTRYCVWVVEFCVLPGMAASWKQLTGPREVCCYSESIERGG